MLEVEALEYAYGDATALTDVSFSVNEGEIVVLLGPNGAGKTTTVKNVAGVLQPDGGHIEYKQSDIAELPVHETVDRGMKLVPGRGIFAGMSVEENISLGMRSIADDRTEEQLGYIFDLFPRLKDRQGQQAGTLSGGEQQMLALALGLTADPDLLMLDEPSHGLMPTLIDEIFDTIQTINEEGTSIFLVEQNVSNALNAADRGYILENGETTISGSADELLNDSRIRERYLSVE
jgi:branched-chain amino acid transport system ATP-binding protein